MIPKLCPPVTFASKNGVMSPSSYGSAAHGFFQRVLSDVHNHVDDNDEIAYFTVR